MMTLQPIDHPASEFNFGHPPADPLEPLQRWFDAAIEAAGTPNPNAMSVATIDPDGKPSVRVVLCRGIDKRGLVFYTNRQSRKGEALRAHPRACANFHWDHLNRQLRVEGEVTLASDAESDAYWQSRPRENQVNACASQQSRPVGSRAALVSAVEEFQRRFEGMDIPRPLHWGGFRIALERIEFWQGHKHRLHDRIAYQRQPDGSFRSTLLCP